MTAWRLAARGRHARQQPWLLARWWATPENRPLMLTAAGIAATAVFAALTVGEARQANRQQEQTALRQDKIARQQERTSREQAEREARRDAPRVSFWYDQPGPATPYADHTTVFHLVVRSTTGITGFHLVLDVKDIAHPDSTTAGTVKLSTSRTIPGCHAARFTIPPELDLATHHPSLKGKVIYLQDPQLTFHQTGQVWQLHAGGTVTLEPSSANPNQFPGPRYLDAIGVGEVANLTTTEVGCAGPT